MTNQKSNRSELLHWINMVSFACNEATLFLDTHPDCQEALDYFEEFNNHRQKALAEYAKYYGPLTLDSSSGCEDHWKWVHEPWPWQEGGC